MKVKIKGKIIMDMYAMSDRAIIKELGQRIRRLRLEQNRNQEEVAASSGISRMTLSFLERGKPFSILTLLVVLRALHALEAVDAFLPDPGLSPLELARRQGRERQRASAKE